MSVNDISMDHTSEDSNSSVGSYRERNSPLNFSKSQCQMSTKASAFSIDALIGKRTLEQMQSCGFSSENIPDEENDNCALPKRTSCDSPPAKRVRHSDGIPLAPLG